jgi:hypothetical protein
MVEFIRDVIIVVAILVTLIAVAFHSGPEPDAARRSDSLAGRVSVSVPITPDTAQAAMTTSGAPTPTLAK